MDIDVRIFFPDVMQKIEIPLKRQLRMVPALHQNLHSTRCGQFIQFLVDLFKREHVMIFIALGPVKRAELAVNIADVRVIDVSIRDVSDDLPPASGVGFFFRWFRRASASAPSSSRGKR